MSACWKFVSENVETKVADAIDAVSAASDGTCDVSCGSV